VTESSARIVSSEDERLILVDPDDNETGFLSKAECHDGDGVLHRAFSVFLFNSNGELLLQQRAAGKRLWPMYWSNSCCSHPREGESVPEAASRRLQDELHAASDLKFVYKFVYQAPFGELGSEHELCHVFLGRIESGPSANETEIEAIRYVSAEALEREFLETPQQFTPWFRMEWQRLTEAYSETLATYISRQAPHDT
jgi:isopentenyl-diphosphate delta-isomerase